MEGSWAPEAPSGAASWAFFPPRTAKNYADDIKLDTNVVKGYVQLDSLISQLAALRRRERVGLERERH